jgi:transcriptional regulator with XRE-family HTH domain
MNMQDLGTRIRTQREKRGLKQNDIAHALQISPQAVSKWERGENAPDISLLGPLAKLLSVSVDWLLGSHSEDLDVFEATVLASGVQIGRRKSEELTPKDFAYWVNDHCFQITEAMLRFDAVPIKYFGAGILCFFSGVGHSERAIRAAVHAVQIAPDALKIGISQGEVYLGSIGHPDYARPDVIGECVGLALLMRDWATQNTKSGVAAQEAVLGSCGNEFRGTIKTGRKAKAEFPGIKWSSRLVEIKGLAE